MLGPDYHQPELNLPQHWSQTPSSLSNGKELSRWWQVFNDPLLTELITKAAMQNLNVQQAKARVYESRIKYKLSQAKLYPILTGSTGVAQSETSQQTGLGLTTELFNHSLDASWEIDLFGKFRRDIEAKTADRAAAEQDLQDVLVSLYAEVALAYVELRNYQARLARTEESVATQQATYQITDWRYQAGLTTRLDVEQAKFSKESTESDLPSLREGIVLARQSLALLLGLSPDALTAKLAKTKPIPTAPKEIALGIPANILKQRPDVRKAESKLISQTAQIGVAEANRYPNLNLTGSIGLEALALGNLYTASAKMFQIAATSAWTLADTGRLKSNVEIQKALQQQALAAYQQTVLTALKEVEQALIGFQQEQDRIQLLQQAVASGQRALELAQYQYQSGISDFQPVLNAQKSLLTMQLNLVNSQAKLASNTIKLYKALGGGWMPIS